MAEVAKGIINIEINTGDSAAQLKALQSQINAFNLSLSKQNKNQAIFAADYAKELQLAISKTGVFTAETVKLTTAAATLDKTLSKGRTSLGQFFSAKFNKDSAVATEVFALAAERARRLQTQFVATSGAAQGMQEAIAIRPLAAFSSEMAITAQKAEIMSSMFKQGTTQLINFGKNVQWAGRQLMVGFTVPLTIFGNTAGKTFMELEKQVVSFKKVYGDLFTTPTELNENIEAVKGLAEEYTKYGVAAKDTIGLAAQAAAAGRRNADLTDAVAQATRLATLGQMDQNAALETTISLQSAFRLSGKDLADTINFLNMVENQTVVSLQDLAAAIPRVAPVVQGLGGDVKDLAVFLAAMQEGGVDAAEGANALKSGLASLINPTKQATQMLSGMGINLQAIIDANKGDLMGTVMSFSQALASLDQFSRQQALEQVFGKFQYAKLGALFDNITRQGSQAQQVIATMGYTTEQLGATAEKELKTIEQSFGVQLTGAVERLKLAIAPIGEIFVKTAIPIVNFLTDLINKFNELSEGKKQFIAIATVIAGVVIPAGTMLFGLLMNLTGTLLKMGQGISLFTKGLVTGGPLGAIRSLTQGSKYLSLAEIDAAMAAQQLAGASEAVNMALLKQVSSAEAAQLAINSLVTTYQRLIAAQSAASQYTSFAVPGSAANIASKGIKTGGAGFKGIRRNKGGMVPGTGNTDTIPALLTPGESVVTKEATAKYAPIIDAMNSGQLPGFIKGVTGARRGMSTGRDVSLSGPGSAKSLFGSLIQDAVGAIVTRRATAARAVSGNTRNLLSNFVYGLRAPINQGLNARARYSGDGKFGIPAKDLEDSMISDEGLWWINKYANGQWNKEKYKSQLKRNIQRQNARANRSGKELRFVDDHVLDDIIQRTMGDPLYANVQFVSIKSLHNSKLLKVLSPEHRKLLLKKETEKVKQRRLSGTGAQRATESTPGLISQTFTSDNLPLKDTEMLAQRASQKSGAIRRKPMAEDIIVVQEGGSSYRYTFDGNNWIKGAEIRARDTWKAITSGSYMRKKGDDKPPSREYQASHVGLNSGGAVPGVGNTDTVPAMLTPGEFVVNKDATKENYDLLNRINNGSQTQRLIRGGKVLGAATQIGGMAAMMSGNPLLMGVGMAAQMIPGMIAGRNRGTGDGGSAVLSGGIKESLKSLKGISIAGRTLSLGMTSLAGGVALAGFAIYKLNKSVNEAQKAGGELAKAMNGSADRTTAMAEAFGRETYADAARRRAVEKAGGQEISQEAQQQASQFMQSDASKQMLADLQLVKKEGKDVAEALRNQLATSIIAGAITTEEARAIAIDMGKALNDQKIAVKVSGELTRLMGVDGKDLLKNLATITAEINPKIDSNELNKEAQAAFDKLNPLQKGWQTLLGGQEEFKKQYSIDAIADLNAAALAREAEARQLLNAALQEGVITLQEYMNQENAISSGAKNRSEFVANANARALGFKNAEEINSAAKRYADLLNEAKNLDTTGMTPQEAQQASMQYGQAVTADTAGKKAYDALVGKSMEDLKQSFISSGMDEEAANQVITGINSGLAQIDPTIFTRMLSQEISQDNIQVLLDIQSKGDIKNSQELDKIIEQLDIISKMPNIDKLIGFDITNKEQLNLLYNDYLAFEKAPDLWKGVKIEDEFSAAFDKFGIDYNWLSSLPNIEKFAILRNIETYETINKRASSSQGDRADRIENAAAYSAVSSMISASKIGQQNPPTNGPGGGGGGKTLDDMKKDLMSRFDIVEKRLSLEAQGYQDIIRLQERQNELDQRSIEQNQRGLEQLKKQEDAVNKAYETRITALDGVSKANDRIKQQEQSRIDLATALASGNIAAAASQISEISAANTANQIEDTRAALELQRENDLKNLKVEINGELLTREQIQERIDSIEENIYQRTLKIRDAQDAVYNIEQQRLANTREREKVETRLFLLEQRKAIVALQGKKATKGLSAEERVDLQTYKDSYNQMAAYFNSMFGESVPQVKMYGGKIKKMAFGGIAYKGSSEPPPALKMRLGSRVPGLGNTDRVPALLTPGEFVINKAAAKANMPLLEMINDSVFPRLNSPTYNVPQSGVGVSAGSVQQNTGIVYNDTYSINVNVAGTNASPEDIANVVIGKLSQFNSGSVRGIRY